jgi:hypothetical protein
MVVVEEVTMRIILWALVALGVIVTIGDYIKPVPVRPSQIYSDVLLIVTGAIGLVIRALLITWKIRK